MNIISHLRKEEEKEEFSFIVSLFAYLYNFYSKVEMTHYFDDFIYTTQIRNSFLFGLALCGYMTMLSAKQILICVAIKILV